MPVEKRFDVFLSYNEKDEAWGRRLRTALADRGISVWFAPDEIDAGSRFPTAIEGGMKTSRAVALIVSPDSVASKWVDEEYNVALALSNGRGTDLRIIPLLLRNAELPSMLSTRQSIDFRDDSQFDERVLALVKALRARPGYDGRIRKSLFVSSEYPPIIYGGLGVHVQKLTAALASHTKVDVLLPNPNREDYEPATAYESVSANVRPIIIPVDTSYRENGPWCVFAKNVITKLTSLRREELPDVIHCHDWVTVLAGVRCRWALNIPLVFHVHLPNRAPLCASIENLGLISADIITVNSEAMSAEIQDRRLPVRKLRVVKNGVDLSVFHPAEKWPADGGYILFTGRLVEQKGIEYLLRAFTYVRQKFPDMRLKIVGEGEYSEWLKRLADNLAVSTHVDFVDRTRHEDLARFYQDARIVVVPSVFEPFGMVALEAMACGRAVVASRTGGLKELVQHGETGFLSQPKEHLDLAQWLMALLADESLRNRMGRAGLQRVRSGGFTWDEIASGMMDIYAEAINTYEVREEPEEAQRFIDQVIKQAPPKDEHDWRSLLNSLFYKANRR